MENLHFLNYNETGANSSEIIEDCFADGMFNENFYKILLSSAGKREILKRQSVFREAENEECLLKLRNVYEGSNGVKTALKWVERAKGDLEKQCMHLKFLDSFLKSARTLAEFSQSSCEPLREIGTFWDNELKKYPQLSDDVKRISEGMKEFLTVNLVENDELWITPDYGSVFYVDILKDCADALGVECQLPFGKGSIRSPYSDFLSLFGGKSEAVRETLDKYTFLLKDSSAELLVSYGSEIDFYLTFIDFKENKGSALPLCYPEISHEKKFYAKDAADISLVVQNIPKIVTNDIYIDESEPFFFIVGANGGGKTSYIRAVGINLLLFLAGCPIFAREAQIYPFDNVFTHFPRNEKEETKGRLNEETVRIQNLYDGMGRNSVILLNETFSSVSEENGTELSLDAAEKIRNSGCFGLFVTHYRDVCFSEYPYLSAEIQKGNDNNGRTFKIVRENRDPEAYINDILRRYRLDEESLNVRIAAEVE